MARQITPCGYKNSAANQYTINSVTESHLT